MIPIIAYLVVIAIAVWYAFAATILWGWFIVPVFSTPALNVWQMFGVMLFIGMMRAKFDVLLDKREIDGAKVAIGLMAPALSIGTGAVIRFWVLA
jgi:hypothetical protein